ncbi:MAG: MotA/TolQ/ExbB proton channel family protein [Candidatus Limiplasma sp.]|nr:MotA/TolQ/ExbB proton channel family protein [Candidatus Limiplasma sp.]
MPMEWLQRLGTFLWDASIYIAIGLVTWVGLVKCIYPVLRNASLLNRAVVQLEKSSAKGKPGIWRDAQFLGRSLREDWQRFLLNARQMDLRGMPYNTDEYINEDSVIYRPGHAQLAELIPSLLTSLGILGTFMGLMQGLTDLNFSNAEGTIRSIPNLLQGMRFAFATSVAGISCSLIFNMLNRVAVGRAFRALDNLDEAFYDLAMPRPLAPDVQMICQKQDEEASLKQAAEEAGSQVAGTLELAISRAMHPLTLSMDQFIKGATQEQVAGVKTVVSQFVQQMNASLDGQLTALGDTMRMVNQGQVQAQQNLQRALQTAELLTKDAQRIQEASREIARQMSALSVDMEREAQRRNSKAQEAQELAAKQSALGEELEALTLSLNRMNAAVEALSQRMDRQALEPVEDLPPPYAPVSPAPLRLGGRKPKAAESGRTSGLEA